MNTQSRNPWPYAIIGWFVIFGGAMAAWVVCALGNKMDLVRRDYYEQEIRYQQQLERQRRTEPWRDEIRVTLDAAQQAITVTLPVSHAAQAAGSIHLYRPSDASLDRRMPLALLSPGKESIDARSLRAGLWKVRVEWTVQGEEYCFEESIVVEANTAEVPQ